MTVLAATVQRCEGAGCDPQTDATTPLPVAISPAMQLTKRTDDSVMPGLTYGYRWVDVDSTAMAHPSETMHLAIPGGGGVGEAVQPNILRSITRGIQGGIFSRIEQRQRQDGRWK